MSTTEERPTENPEYVKGDRVQLIYTDDEYTDLKPGALGTVNHLEAANSLGRRVLNITWDGGHVLSMLIDEGDHVMKVEDQAE